MVRRSTADMLDEAVRLLEAVVRREGYAPQRREGDSVERVLMLARSICFRWPDRDADDAPTAKLPPVRDRILPRPPAPEVRELRGAELLRALADELRDYDEDQADEDGR